MTENEIIRTYYSGWEKKEWSAVESLLADDFTFTSPNGDDHIGKGSFKAKCWPEAKWIARFELESVIERDNEAFVKYLCRTENGRSFRNIEHFRFAGGKVAAIDCYFGGHQGYPSAVNLNV
ncbi:MAG: nuclear transport factor 2 family protein, partial [Blastocatellia bacterium]